MGNMKHQVKDGWHTVLGYRVFVVGGHVIRGVRNKAGIGLCPARPFSLNKYHEWDFDDSMTLDNFRRKLNNSTALLY